MSTSAATAVQVLSRPATLVRSLTCTGRFVNRGALPLALGGLIEQAEPQFAVARSALLTWGDYPDDFACRQPVNFVARLYLVLISDRLGESDLELGCDLCHLIFDFGFHLTLARI